MLNALIDKGLVKLGNYTTAEDKRRYAYILTAKGISEKAAITRRFLARKMEEYEAVKAEMDAPASEIEDTVDVRVWGLAWGRSNAQFQIQCPSFKVTMPII